MLFGSRGCFVSLPLLLLLLVVGDLALLVRVGEWGFGSKVLCRGLSCRGERGRKKLYCVRHHRYRRRRRLVEVKAKVNVVGRLD